MAGGESPAAEARFVRPRETLVVLRLAILIDCISAAALLGQAAPTHRSAPSRMFANMEVVPLAIGPNAIDLDGDGTPDMVFQAWRDNGNAHGFNTITFYLSRSSGAQWLLVPLFDQALRKERDFYRDFRGADCVLEAMTIVRSKTAAHTPVELVLGSREIGDSFADSMPVTFTVYELVSDTMPNVGEPEVYFRAARSFRGRRRYCDINDAFEKELGLGHYDGPS